MAKFILTVGTNIRVPLDSIESKRIVQVPYIGDRTRPKHCITYNGVEYEVARSSYNKIYHV